MNKYILKIISGFLVISRIICILIDLEDFFKLNNHTLRRIREETTPQLRDRQKVMQAIEEREEPIKLMVFDFDGVLRDEDGNVPQAIVEYFVKIIKLKQYISIISLNSRRVIEEQVKDRLAPLLTDEELENYFSIYGREDVVPNGGKGAILAQLVSRLEISYSNVMTVVDRIKTVDRGLAHPMALKFQLGEYRNSLILPEGTVVLETKKAAGSIIILSVYLSYISDD